MSRWLFYVGTVVGVGLNILPAQATTQYVETPRWSFSYSNDGLEGIVLRNVWYTSPSGESALVAQWLAMEFFRVRYQDDAAGPYSDNFQLNSPFLYIGCPSDFDEQPENLCSIYEGGCEADPTAPGCNDSSEWDPPAGGVSVCEQESSVGEIRLTAQGGYNCGQYRFIETFTFKEDGTLVLHLDAKGIQATNVDGTSREHLHYAYFRLDIDADGDNNIVRLDSRQVTEEVALNLEGLSREGEDGNLVPYIFSFDQPASGRSVWAWGPNADARDSEAHHGEATWVDWSLFDAWYHRYHAEEAVGFRAPNLLGPPIGACGGDELVEYEGNGPYMVNREDILNDISETLVTKIGRKSVQMVGDESLAQSDAILWLNTPLYHDADPSSTEHGCHDVEVQLRPSWGGCYPLVGASCDAVGGLYQCDGSCE